ncbi:MAG: hypothetical protein WBE92_01670 [Steroidobacteraceae bacterium]
MRTTLIIEDALFRRTKHQAAEQGATLSDVVNDALRTYLAREVSDAAPFRFVTYGRPGKIARHEPSDFAQELDIEDRERLRQ